MATTTNYGWAEPDNTSLVKNGAQDIRILGDAIDASVWNIGYGQAGKNRVINGGFDIWARGSSFAPVGSVIYTADRWCTYRGGAATALTRQSVSPNYSPYYLRYGRNSGDTGTAALLLSQSIETFNSLPLAGKTITFSFYARKGANYSATSNALVLFLNYGTGTDQNLLASFTGSTSLTNPTATLTSSWTRYTYTVAVPVTATEIGWYFQYTPTGTAGAADYFDMADVQLEVGSTATPYARASGSFGGELALCQRYYYPLAITNIDASLTVNRTSTTTSETMIYLPVSMRTVPTISSIAVGGVFGRLVGYDTAFGVTVVNVTAVGLSACFNSQALTLGFTNAALTYAQGAASCSFDNQNVASTIAFSAEL
jgi:hypothetical protein